MTSYMEYILGGARIVWTCTCGYSTKDYRTGMYMDNTTHMNDTKTKMTNHI